jgi:formimidoylglutamate deiminase
MTTREGESTGRRLIDAALGAGAQALAQPIGAIARGCRADIVMLDADHVDLTGRSADQWLDSWAFTAGQSAVRTVMAGGERVVEDGRHLQRPEIEIKYKRALSALVG